MRDPDIGDRLALHDPKTRAQGVFLDPAIALTAPASLAEGSSLNAFAMAAEGVQSRTIDPLAEAALLHRCGYRVAGCPGYAPSRTSRRYGCS